MLQRTYKETLFFSKCTFLKLGFNYFMIEPSLLHVPLKDEPQPRPYPNNLRFLMNLVKFISFSLYIDPVIFSRCQ